MIAPWHSFTSPGTRNLCTALLLVAELALPTCGSEIAEVAWLSQFKSLSLDSNHPTSLLPLWLNTDGAPAVVVPPSSKPLHNYGFGLETAKSGH